MQNLIIIGNGFDLAHGLKTSYNDFIEDLFNNYFMDNRQYARCFVTQQSRPFSWAIGHVFLNH
ncbi:MAG: bacteriophage abortive infection AbiH family protein [Tannerella sp.]|jgi:hypothetical protein|nr:bacteriophage abortive infection AbiH family protein [Tannerella sp.]